MRWCITVILFRFVYGFFEVCHQWGDLDLQIWIFWFLRQYRFGGSGNFYFWGFKEGSLILEGQTFPCTATSRTSVTDPITKNLYWLVLAVISETESTEAGKEAALDRARKGKGTMVLKGGRRSLSNGDDGDLDPMIFADLRSQFYGKLRFEWLMVMCWCDPSLVFLGFILKTGFIKNGFIKNGEIEQQLVGVESQSDVFTWFMEIWFLHYFSIYVILIKDWARFHCDFVRFGRKMFVLCFVFLKNGSFEWEENIWWLYSKLYICFLSFSPGLLVLVWWNKAYKVIFQRTEKTVLSGEQPLQSRTNK